MRRVAVRSLAILGVLLAVLAVRVVTGSRAELARGQSFEIAGNVDGAMLAYRRAVRLYAPGNPYGPRALERLFGIARRAEAEGDTARALAAYRSIRGGILAARSVYVPHAAPLARAEARIAALSSPSERGRRATLEALSDPQGPALGWTLLLLLGWLSWTGAAFAFAQRAIDQEDRLVLGAARVWGTLFVVGFGVFVIGMAMA